jgi:hypothetical protein
VLPLVRHLIEEEGVGEREGGVGFAEVEADGLLLGGAVGLAQDYSVWFAPLVLCSVTVRLMSLAQINSIPTLLAFDKSEAQVETRLTDLKDLKSKEFVRRWIEKEASRQGYGGAGGKVWGLFG